MLKLKLKLRLPVQSKEIPGFPNYDLHIYGDNDFRVWSKPRVDSRGCKRGNSYLTNSLNNKGYLQVGLMKDGKAKTVYIHLIVAWIFCENPDNKPTVDHKDRNPENNRPGNLRWATRREQQNNQGMYSTNKSGTKGVCLDKGSNKWRVQLTIDGVQKHFGRFADLKDAIACKDRNTPPPLTLN